MCSAAATVPFATAATASLATAGSVRGATSVLWSFWYYSAAVIVVLVMG